MKHLPSVLLLCLLVTALPSLCHGHNIRVFAWREATDIIAEAKFSSGRVAKNVAVTVIDLSTGQELLQGNTDLQGLYRFPIPQESGPQLSIVVDGGDGHKASWNYALEQKNATATTNMVAADITENVKHTPPAENCQDQYKALFEASLERELAPIRRSLAESSQRGVSLQDLFGGLGYILGLAGIGALVQARKNKE